MNDATEGRAGRRSNGRSDDPVPWESVGSMVREAGVVIVDICSLRFADSPRLGGLDRGHIRTLASIDHLPPILVHRDTMLVIDGMHRVRAAQLNQRSLIEAIFFQGRAEDVFRLAVQSNVAHGMPLTLADRQVAAERILRSHPRLSDRAVAVGTGLGTGTIAMVRRRVTDGPPAAARLGRDGRVRPLSTEEGRWIAQDMIARRPDASLREIARAAGVSVGTVRDVRARISRGESPIPPARQRGVRAAAVSAVPTVTDADQGEGPASNDANTVLGGLMHDPSLRYSASGRVLLRWLGSAGTLMARWRDAADAVPPHCSTLVARIARHHARTWEDLADELEGKRKSA